MHYEVQHYTLLDGWINSWLCDEGDGILRPETFATRDEAEAALDEYLQDLEEEFQAGNSGPYSRDEFRVECMPEVIEDEDPIALPSATGGPHAV